MSVSATMSVFVSSHLRVDQEPLKLLQPLLRARAKNDLQGFLDCYSEKDLEYSNYAAGKLRLKREQAVGFLRGTFGGYTVGEWRFTSICGTRDFCTLEGKFLFTAEEDTLLHHEGTSEEVSCITLFRFNKEDKITMQHDYYCFQVVD